MGGNVSLSATLTPEQLRVKEYISTLPLFMKEKSNSLDKIAQCFELLEFSKGEHLIHQGEESGSMFLIVEGTVQFYSLDSKTGAKKDLGVLGAGNTFGEFGLVYDVRRTAGAIAADDLVVVLRLDRETYDKIKNTKFMNPLTIRVKHVCAALMKDGLKQLPLLKGLDPEILDDLGHLFKFEVVPPSTTICHEGEKADRFYIIFHGQLIVTMKDDLNFDVEVGQLGPGDKFGDKALLGGMPRTATVTAVTGCELFTLDGPDFKEFLKTVQPQKVDHLRKRMMSSSFVEILKANAPIFKSISIKSQQLLGWFCKVNVYAKDQVIIQEGTSDNKDIFVVYEGTVGVFAGPNIVRKMDTGYFGELSLFTNKPNSKTVRALSTCKCLRIPYSKFKSVMRKEKAVLSEIAIKIMGGEVPMEHILNHPEARKAFLKHCTKEFAEENIDFWLAVTELEDISDHGNDENVLKILQRRIEAVKEKKQRLLHDRCEMIYDKFVKPGADSEINISSEVRETLTKKVTNGDYSYTMFDAAKAQVYKLLEADNFVRYKESDVFKMFMSEIGVYY